MKRRLLVIFSVIAILALLGTGSLAYYTAQGTASNIITTGNVQLRIVETSSDGSAFPAEGVTIMPGDTVSKILQVENTGGSGMYLRVQLHSYVEGSQLSAEGCMEIDIDTQYWTLKDGWYYYNSAIEPGEMTQPLFTGVHFNGDAVDNKYLGKVFALDVSAHAVQSANNGETVWQAAGWPVI